MIEKSLKSAEKAEWGNEYVTMQYAQQVRHYLFISLQDLFCLPVFIHLIWLDSGLFEDFVCWFCLFVHVSTANIECGVFWTLTGSVMRVEEKTCWLMVCSVLKKTKHFQLNLCPRPWLPLSVQHRSVCTPGHVLPAGRGQRSSQWVMCPDYNQLPTESLQRAPEEMERGKRTALHGVITGRRSGVPTPHLQSTVRLKDRPVNNPSRLVSAAGGDRSSTGACHLEFNNSLLKHTLKNTRCSQQGTRWSCRRAEPGRADSVQLSTRLSAGNHASV